MSDFQMVGVAPEVLDDSRVQTALAAVTGNPEKDAAKAVLHGLQGGLEKYGVKLRPISVTIVGPMMVRMLDFKPAFPKEYQISALLFLLGAPLRDIYKALDVGEEKGIAEFMTIVAEWIEASGIPQDMSEELMARISETFSIATKLIGGGGGDDGKKKC
jgi:hypothetical protein